MQGREQQNTQIIFSRRKQRRKKCLVGSKRICFACCVWNKIVAARKNLAHRTYSGTYMLDTVNDLCAISENYIAVFAHYLNYKRFLTKITQFVKMLQF